MKWKIHKYMKLIEMYKVCTTMTDLLGACCRSVLSVVLVGWLLTHVYVLRARLVNEYIFELWLDIVVDG